ncbi:MAG: hypothetical protein JSR47_24045, partial [Proteobacteria bacterium]|nr:hypothetical protein [Pseudomonadota bacterium]
PDAIADAMNEALIMPLDERRQRHLALKEKVYHTTAARYAKTFVDALAARSVAKVAA